ncbi:MAG: UbiA family prenyltransferase, partial [Opitutales bacterium]|nr:UbiA family prenyltransferase [Opitutales bacterium]
MIFIKKAKVYADLIKLAHTMFALPFALSAVALAHIEGGKLSLWLIFWIFIAFTAARSSAMGFNRVVDADIDALNPRTQSRPSVSGKISIKDTKFFTAISAIIFVISAFFINILCGFLSIPALIVLFGYSYAKRFTFLAHYILGVALALAPIGAWIAVTGSLDVKILLLGGCLFFSIAGFDLIYALQDMEFDIAHKLHSIPAKFGKKNTLIIAGISFIISTLLLFSVGYAFKLN